MCVIIHGSVATVRRHFVDAWASNPDGFGAVVPTSRTVYRTLDAVDAAAWLARLPRDEDVLAHFRYKTHGVVSKRMCHPFVTTDRRWVIAHNGVIHGYGSDRESDTAQFVREIPPGLSREDILAYIEMADPVSRFAVYDVKGRSTHFVGGWEMDSDGSMHSNYTLLRRRSMGWASFNR